MFTKQRPYILAHFVAGKRPSGMIKFFQILRYNKIMCEHVYKNLGPGPCPKCGLETHSINWGKEIEMMKSYKEKVGYFYNTSQWWSI